MLRSSRCSEPQQRSFDFDDADRARADSSFRPIQYLGNKSRALDAIDSVMADLVPEGSLVCDLFSGSGVVAASLAMKYDVLAADIQEYARVLAEALLRPSPIPSDVRKMLGAAGSHAAADMLEGAFGRLAEAEKSAIQAAVAGDGEHLADVVEFGSLASFEVSRVGGPSWLGDLLEPALRETHGVLSHYYGGVYFSYQQAAELDGLLAAIDSVEDPTVRRLGLAAAISTASEIVSTVGSHFAQPVQGRSKDGAPKPGVMRTIARRRLASAVDTFADWLKRYSDLPVPATNGRAIRGDFRDVLANLPTDVRAIYADPPYTRDHYSRFYHVLETIALRDDPGLSFVQVAGGREPSRGLYRRDRHQSPFCVASQVEAAFGALFDGASRAGAHLVLSYSPLSEGTAARPQTRLMTIEQIEQAACARFRSVRTVPVGGFAHSKFNAAHLNASSSYEAEVLIICEQ